MNKTKKRSFTALLVTLAMMLVLVLSLGVFCACGGNGNETASTWHYGTSAPENDLGKNGDRYFDTESLTAYVMQDGEWVPTNLYKGTSKPDDTQGKQGDLYLDTANGVLYEKGASQWHDVLTIKGEPGRSGVKWFSGDKVPETGDPAIKDAQTGDFYLQNGTFDVYQLQEGGTWDYLGTLKGEPGDDAVDPVQFYDGDGAPSEEITKKANVGDLYLGRFSGLEGEAGARLSGYRLYRYNGTDWDILMEDLKEGQINIYTYEQLLAFAQSVEKDDYAGKVVHLKTDIDFNDVATMSFRSAVNRIAATPWTPIGTAENPFKGTFDGEGHKIENFSAKTTDSTKAAGFFGYIDGATIEHLHFVGVNVEVASGSVGAAVVGEATGKVTFLDVTVEGYTAQDDGATVGVLVGSLAGSDEETSVTVEGGSFEGSGVKDLIGDQGDVTHVTVTDTSIADEDGTTQEWDENGKIVHRVGTAQELIDLVNDRADWTGHKIVLTDNIDTYSITPIAANKTTEGADSRIFYNYYIASFNGELDGAGYSISLRSDDPAGNQKSGSLFRELVGGAYIHNIVFKLDAPVDSEWTVNYLNRGAVAYTLTAQSTEDVITIEDVKVTGRADGLRAAFLDRCGTIDGIAGTLNFVNCTSDVEVTLAGFDNVDKMAGFLSLPYNWNVNFTDCVNSGNWAGEPTNPAMGGFISYAQGDGNNTITFTRCKNMGNMTDLLYSGDPDVGGFIGKVQRPTNIVFTDCINTGTIFCDGANTISIGGFIGHASGSVTFNGTNVNGEYKIENGVMTPVEGKGTIKVETSNGMTRAGGFIGFPDSGTQITVNGTLVNAGKVTVKQITKKTNSVKIYAGGLFGETGTPVTFADGCNYYNLGNVEAEVQNAAGSVAYVGGIVGYVSGGTYTLGTATGYNTGTLTATNADTIYIGSFAGYAVASSGLTEEGLTGFTDDGSVGKKIGQTA